MERSRTLRNAALTRGCIVDSTWIFDGGRALGYLAGAPDFVNGPFLEAFPGANVPPGTITVLLCRPVRPSIADGFAGPTENMPSGEPYADVPGATLNLGLGVSASRVVVATNDFMAIYTRDGKLLDDAYWPDLFASVQPQREGHGSPTMLYDAQSGRFITVTVSGRLDLWNCTPGQCEDAVYVAVSKTSTPSTVTAADWYVYRFDGTTVRYPDGTTRTDAVMIDDPVLSVYRGWLVISGATSYLNGEGKLYPTALRAIPLAPLLDGRGTQQWTDYTEWRDPVSGVQALRAQPATMLSDAPQLFLASPSGSGCSFTIWGIDLDAAAPQALGQAVPDLVPTGQCGPTPVPAPQPGDVLPIDPGEGRVAVRPVFRDGHLFVTRGIPYVVNGATVTGVLWAEIDVSAWPAPPTVVQSGVYVRDGEWNEFPSIMPDRWGRVVLPFNTAGPTTFPSLRYSVHLPTDAPGALETAAMVKAGTTSLDSGTGPTTLSRGSAGIQPFGTSTAAALDPVDGTVWMIGQFAGDPRRAMSWVAHLR